MPAEIAARARSRDTRTSAPSLSLQEKTLKTPVYTTNTLPAESNEVPESQQKPMLARSNLNVSETENDKGDINEKFVDETIANYSHYLDELEKKNKQQTTIPANPHEEDITVVDGEQKEINISTLSAMNTTTEIENENEVVVLNNDSALPNPLVGQSNDTQPQISLTIGKYNPMVQPTNSGKFQNEQKNILARSRAVMEMANTTSFPASKTVIEGEQGLRGEVLSLRGQLRRLQSAVRSANETTDAESVSSNVNRSKANEKSVQAVQSVISQLKSRVAALTEELNISRKENVKIESELREVKIAYNNLKLQHASLTEEASAWVVSKETLIEERRQHTEEITELHLSVENLRARNHSLEKTIQEIHQNDEEIVQKMYEKAHTLEAENESLKARNKEMNERLMRFESQDVETAKIEVENAKKTVHLLENSINDLKRKLEQTKRDHAAERDDLLAAITALEEGQSSDAVNIIRELREELVKTRKLVADLAKRIIILGGDIDPSFTQWGNKTYDNFERSNVTDNHSVVDPADNAMNVEFQQKFINDYNNSNNSNSNSNMIGSNGNQVSSIGPNNLNIATSSVIQPRSQPLRTVMQTYQIVNASSVTPNGNAASPNANLYLSSNGEQEINESAQEEDMQSWIKKRVQKMYNNGI